MVLSKYDKYMCPDGANDYLSDSEILSGTFDLVVTCSVFEHLLGIDDVNEVLSLANETGIIATHVLVCEEVPNDPDWFYLLDGQCTIWTNKAFARLYDEYGFKGCAYHLESRMWLFFKDVNKYYEFLSLKDNIAGTWTVSDRFVAYWKTKPYR